MKNAFLTIAVTHSTTAAVLEALTDAALGHVKVLASGDINVSDNHIEDLPNEIWLYEPEVELKNSTRLRLVDKRLAMSGRWVSNDELQALKQFGVCTEVHVSYAGAAPSHIAHKEAMQAEVSYYGLAVADADSFTLHSDSTAPELFESGTEMRWLRVQMPAWFNPVK